MIIDKSNFLIFVPFRFNAWNNIINYNAEDRRRLDLLFSVSYDADIVKAKQVIADVVKKNNLIFTDPEPVIAVKEHAASSVNITCLIWCPADEYWNVFYYMQEEIKLAFDDNKISIPYGQLDVHITKEWYFWLIFFSDFLSLNIKMQEKRHENQKMLLQLQLLWAKKNVFVLECSAE